MIKRRQTFFNILLTSILCYVGMEHLCLAESPSSSAESLFLYISKADYEKNKEKIFDCVYLTDDGHVLPATFNDSNKTGCEYEKTGKRQVYHWYNGGLTNVIGLSFLSTKTINVCEKELESMYVSHCGEKKLGINLLYGYTDSTNTRVCNFFDHSKNSQTVNLENLRTYFNPNSTKDIKYTDSSNTEHTVTTSEIENCRRRFLENYCNPFNSNTKPKCLATCPAGGETENSTYTYELFRGNGEFASLSEWNFHTIADCGTNTFKDDSGTFAYYDGNNTDPQLVKYSASDNGSRFYY